MGRDFTEVQVNLSIGEDGHVRYITRVPAIDYRPVPLLDSFQFGTLERLAAIEGEPSLELAMVAIPLTQVESSRNGLWLANENWAAQLKAPLPNLLKRGRSGTLVG